MSTQETAKTLYVEVDGIKYAHRIIGEQTPSSLASPPLLLLNHFRSNIDLWDPLVVNALATSRLVITYDYSGVGHSTGAVKLSVAAFASDVISFLTTLLPTLPGTPTAVDVLGFSIGGYVAQQLTLDAPHLVRKLVLSGTGPSGSAGDVAHRRPMAEVQSAIMSDPPNGSAILDAFFPSFTTRESGIGEAWFGRVLAGRAAVAGKDGEPEFVSFTSGPGLKNFTQALLGWDADLKPYAFLQTIQKETLVTAGSNDLIVSTVNSFELARNIPRAHFVMFPGSGHGHLFQYAVFFAEQVDRFLKGGYPTAPFAAGEINELASAY
ncbi:Alpha/Beta hydrolase protein [Lasiosphaeria hispida]|uniref:Alpha/Beta hydrolase protein n=1 Tax=Lasiosphaeria hispida TaxID=260671 RepID=A0AAJ0HKQ4_9PEZI|nr:Alpha/Beta hydrolase protein [Lasiosphaeria hispida]